MTGGRADIIRGRDLESRVYFQGKAWNLLIKSCTVEEIGEVYEDDVNGEDMARPMVVIHGYLVTCECYEDGSQSILNKFIAARAAPGGGVGTVGGGLRFNFRNGKTTTASTASFIFGGITALAPFRLNAGGRKEAIMHSVVFRAQTFTNTASA